MIRIAVHGTGRMAAAIVKAAGLREDISIEFLVGPVEPDWESPVPWRGALDDLSLPPQLLIDFTLPEGTRAAAAWCAERRVPLLSGVTGLSADIQALLETTAATVPVLWSPNLSLGVNLLAELAGRAAAILPAATPVLIEDIHHQWKKDAPSGTALMLGGTIADEHPGRDEEIEYRSIREGEVIGVHTITFKMDGEEFDLVHRAHDRRIYASGALEAARWLIAQPPGFYLAKDWLSGR